MSDPLQELLDAVAAGDDVRAEQAALALGRHLAGQADCCGRSPTAPSKRDLDDVVLSTLRDMLTDADPDHRWWAVRGLAAVGTQAALDLLITALDDPNPDVRACAAQGASVAQFARESGRKAGLCTEAAVAGLVRCLADPSAFVSRIAADSLARIGTPAVPALIVALQEGDASTRAGAARAMSIIRPPDAIPALCAALDDPSAIVVYYAEEALERMGVGLVFLRP